MNLTEMLATIDTRIAEVEVELGRFDELKAERRRLKKARGAIAKAFGESAQAPGSKAKRPSTDDAAPRDGRQARPTTAAAERERQILAFLRTPRTSAELGGLLGISAAGALYNLNQLLNAKKVQRSGQGASTRWTST